MTTPAQEEARARARCPFTVKGLEGQDPYPQYDRLREHGGIVWDDGMKAWMVTTVEGCRRMMAHDVERLRFWTQDLSDEAKEIQGHRGLKLATGDYQFRLHSWWVRQFAASGIEPFREPGIRPLVHSLIDRFIERGSVDFIEEFATALPVRAVCVIMGLPWQDDAWADRCFQTMKPIERFFNYSTLGGDDVMQAARRAAREMNQVLMPFVEARRGATGDAADADMISRLWRDGPTLRDDWNVEDVVTNVRHLFFAGSETTVHTLANAFYLLLTQPALREEIRAMGDRGIANFTEEALRLYGPVQFRIRKANEDIEIEGILVKKDEAVVSAQSIANRDPNKYPNPGAVDLNRRAPRDHIAFNTGPRTCVGASLARMEVQESVKAFLERLPDMRLDPSAPAPTLHGFQLREFFPIRMQFTPEKRHSVAT